MTVDDLILPDFDGKIVILYFTNTTDAIEGLAVEQASFRMLGNRLFIEGTAAESPPSDWAAGQPCGACWDLVAVYMVFDSKEQYLAQLKRFDARNSG